MLVITFCVSITVFVAAFIGTIINYVRMERYLTNTAPKEFLKNSDKVMERGSTLHLILGGITFVTGLGWFITGVLLFI